MSVALTIHPAPDEADISTRYRLTVAGQDCPVIKSPCYQVHYAMFDLANGPVELELTADEDGYWNDGVKIHPLSRGIEPVIDGRSLRFTIEGACQLSIERSFVTGEDSHAEVMYVYANPPEQGAPDPDDPDVLYFGPGVHRLEDNIELQSGQTLYLAGGAIVWADGVRATDAENIAVRGRGSLNALVSRKWDTAVAMKGCRDILFEGIAMFVYSEQPEYGLQHVLRECDRILFRHYKTVGSNINTDGIHLNGCSDLVVQDCFLRGHDDLIAVYGEWQTGRRNYCDNILVERCVFWAEGQSGIVRIGWPGYWYHNGCRGFTLRDCDVLHTGLHQTPEAALLDMRSNNGRCFEFHDILFENVRIEEIDTFLNIALQDTRDGRLTNVRFKNIHLLKRPWRKIFRGQSGSAFLGSNETDPIIFENITLEGRPVHSPDELDMSVYGRCEREPHRVRFLDADGRDIAPLPVIRSDTQAGPAPLSVTFDGSDSTSPNGEIVRYEWSFGDGQTAEGARVSHTYAHQGRYLVTLRVADSAGAVRSQPLKYVNVANHGLLAEHYFMNGLMDLAVTTVDRSMDRHWGRGMLHPELCFDRFSIRWSGELLPQVSEPHTFHVESNGGIRLFINDRRVIDQWEWRSGGEGAVDLAVGVPVRIRLEYRDRCGEGLVRLSWSSPSRPRSVVPTDCLRPVAGDAAWPEPKPPLPKLESFVTKCFQGVQRPIEMESWRLERQMGMEFVPRRDLVVHGLGRCIDGQWNACHVVRLWDVEGPELLAEENVLISSPRHSSGCRFAPMVEPVRLRAGRRYRLLSVEYEEQDRYLPRGRMTDHTDAAEITSAAYCQRHYGYNSTHPDTPGQAAGVPTFLYEDG